MKVLKVLEVLRILVQPSSYDGNKELSFIPETTMNFYDEHLLKRFAVCICQCNISLPDIGSCCSIRISKL